MGEITYGIERISMYLQEVDNIQDLVWTKGSMGIIKYGDIYNQNPPV